MPYTPKTCYDAEMKDYLGDGLYVEFDGWQFRLYASDGVRVTNEVFLDELVVRSFFEFVKTALEVKEHPL